MVHALSPYNDHHLDFLDPEGIDIETERLRAALQGTPGEPMDDSYKEILLGVTPASSDDHRLSGSHPGRSYSRISIGGGRLSEKSSGLRSSRDRGTRLADLLEEMHVDDEELLDDLPHVEDEMGLQRIRDGGGITQFSLKEQSERSTQFSQPREHQHELLRNTIDVLV